MGWAIVLVAVNRAIEDRATVVIARDVNLLAPQWTLSPGVVVGFDHQHELPHGGLKISYGLCRASCLLCLMGSIA